MADLKKVYAAIDEQTELYELETFDEKWSGKYPKIALSGRPTGPIYPCISSIPRRSEP